VAFLPEPALITLTRQGERLLWAARLEKGEAPVALHELTLVADQAYNQPFGAGSVSQVYVRAGNTLQCLSTGGMPVEMIWLAYRFPEVPLETIRAEGVGQELVEHLEKMGALEDAPAVQEISVRPRVEFYLASTQRLHVRAVAEGGEDLMFVRREAGHWTLASSKETHVGDLEYAPVDEGEEVVASEETAVDSTAIAYRAREKDLEAVDVWLEQLVPEYARQDSTPAGLPSLSWSMRDMGVLDLIAIWDQRPRNAAYYGNQALRDLLSLRRPPRYDFEVEASGVQWLTVSVSMQEAVDALSFEEVAAALKEQDTPNILLRGGGRYRREDLEAYETQVRTLADVGIAPDSGAQRVHALQLGALSGEVFGDAAGNAQKLIDQAQAMRRKFKGIPKVKLSPSLTETVRPYQQTGVDFLVWACVNFGGAILADDMGLGKTLQVLAALTVLRRKKGGKKPALVVCPASVTHNWQREAARFTPGLRTLVLESGEARKAYYGKLDQYDLVIKNYSLARRDIETLREQEWGVVCIDEAQAIKNPNAAISKALKTLEAKHRIALTGTPIENRLSDLWSIVDFAVPGYLPPREAFEKKSGGAADALAYTRLRARLRPILLRRLKGEVAPELPPRIEERLDCTMTSGQRRAYLTELRRAQDLLRGTTGKQVAGQSRIQILAALTRLRQLCCDPALRNIPKAGSGKVDVFLACIDELMESGHKVLVFSQFVTMLELLAPKLKKRKIKQYMLTGKTRKRAELVAAFESDPDPSVFLISLKAGGSGLNLVSASYVVLFDPWWNPAVEAQAIDRTHRIGQDKTVVAYRLVTEDSIEERILELQEKKREIVANVLEADAFNRSLSREDFAFILE
jgi:superfamily II DNA or RNA helicase